MPSGRVARPISPQERNALDGLGVLLARRDAADAAVRREVAQLRTAGVPWRTIAAALGTTPSAAFQRYGKDTPADS